MKNVMIQKGEIVALYNLNMWTRKNVSNEIIKKWKWKKWRKTKRDIDYIEMEVIIYFFNSLNKI